MPVLRCLVCALICTAASPAFAVRFVNAAANYPGAPQPVYNDPAPLPYAMTYSEETARALGAHSGGLDIASSGGGMAPAVSVGSGAGAPMLKLQWRP